MLSVILMFVSLFVWAYSIPLLLVMALVGVPIALPLFLLGLCVSWYLQLAYDAPIPKSSIRTVVNRLDFTSWFGNVQQKRIPPNKRYLITSHPHGIFCLSTLLCVHFVPESTTLIAVSPLIFQIPVLGWFAGHLGCIPCSKESIRSALKVSSVILVPGGVPEVVMYERNEIYTERYGMFEFDADILPVVSKQRHYHVPRAPLYDLRLFVAKKYGVPIIFPWVFGWKNTWLPKRKPLTVQFLPVEKRSRLEYFKLIKKNS
jgi:hypothetical protein